MNHIKDIKRLKTLLAYGILDTPPDAYFDDFAKLVSIICETPIALISFIDDRRQWFKAKVGMEVNEVPVEETICQYTISQDGLLEISDTKFDERLTNNPRVATEDSIRFYVGIPISAPNGSHIGTVCAVDMVPRKLNQSQKNALNIVANHVMLHLETINKNKDLSEELKRVLEQKISETKKELSRKEIAYKNLFEAIAKSNAVAEFDQKGEILSINPKFEEIFGYSAKEIVGKHHSVLLPDFDSSGNGDFWKNLSKGRYVTGRFMRLHKNGESVWVQASFSPVLDNDGSVLRITKIAQNITAEIQAQEELKKAKAIAEDLNVQKDMFLANMSHEIRTPINSIIGFTSLLIERERDVEKFNQIQAIKAASDSLLYLVNDILDLSKIESGSFFIDEQPFNLHAVVENVFSILNVKASEKRIAFTFHIQDDIEGNLIGDKNRLSQILINLLGNAIKFTSKGKVSLKIHIREYHVSRPVLQFDVSDTGIGVAENKLTQIFERFTQAEANTTKKYGGTGLGLNITKQLIEKQAGEIWVSSELDKGSVFSFYLPFSLTGRDAVIKENNKTVIDFAQATGKILMCEDNVMNQVLAKAIFKQTAFELDMADNGAIGVEMLKNQHYDAVIMDIQMPEMDGYQATLTIRNELKLNVPIIGLSAHAMSIEKEKCLNLGMNDYLSKPFKKEELFASILKHIDKVKKKALKIKKESVLPEKELFSLTQLEEISDGNVEFQVEMMEMFITQSTQGLKELMEHYHHQEFLMASKIAHKLKSSFGIILANPTTLSRLETELKDAKNPDAIQINIKKIEKEINALNQQLIHQLKLMKA